MAAPPRRMNYLVCGLVVAAAAVLCSSPTVLAERGGDRTDDAADGEERAFLGPTETVVQIIAEGEDFQALLAAVVAADLVEAIAALPTKTVMAPKNIAFCRLGARVLDIAECSNFAARGNDENCTAGCWVPAIDAALNAGILPNILLSHVVANHEVTLRELKKAKTKRNAITTLGTYEPDNEPFYFKTVIFKNGDESVLCKVLAVTPCFPLYSGKYFNEGYVKTAHKATDGIVWPIDSILDPY